MVTFRWTGRGSKYSTPDARVTVYDRTRTRLATNVPVNGEFEVSDSVAEYLEQRTDSKGLPLYERVS